MLNCYRWWAAGSFGQAAWQFWPKNDSQLAHSCCFVSAAALWRIACPRDRELLGVTVGSTRVLDVVGMGNVWCWSFVLLDSVLIAEEGNC